MIKRKNEIEVELSNLRVLQTRYRTSRYNLQDNISNFLPKAIGRAKDAVSNYERDIVLRDKNMTPEFVMNVAGRNFTERKDAAELYHKLAVNQNAGRKIAAMYGFEITPVFTDSLVDKNVTVKGAGSYRVPVSDSALGSLTRLENFFKGMSDGLLAAKQNLSARETELISAKAELEKPFEHEQRILDLSSELASIEAELRA